MERNLRLVVLGRLPSYLLRFFASRRWVALDDSTALHLGVCPNWQEHSTPAIIMIIIDVEVVVMVVVRFVS